AREWCLAAQGSLATAPAPQYSRRGSRKLMSISTPRRAGFRGGLNWYRNIDKNWELLAPWIGAKVAVPALYMAGDRDLVLAFRGMDQLLPRFVPNLRETIIFPGCGNWTQQERSRRGERRGNRVPALARAKITLKRCLLTVTRSAG